MFQPQSPSEQYAQAYLFSLSGWAIKNPFPEARVPFLKINVARLKSNPWKDAITEDKYRSSVEFTARELNTEAEDATSVKRCLVVGVMPLLDSVPSRKGKSKIQILQGEMLPDDTTLVNQPMTKNGGTPFIVVTPITNELPGGAKLYALADPRDGLSEGFIVAQDSVFYLPEFRDTSSSKLLRSKNWPQIIRNKIQELCLRTGDPSEAVSGVRGRGTHLVLKLEPKKRLSIALGACMQGYRDSNEAWYLHEIKRIIEEVQEDVQHRPRQDALRSFCVANSHGFDGKAFVEEFYTSWPNAPKVEPETVDMVKHIMNESCVDLPYHHLRGFVVMVAWAVREERVVDLALINDIVYKMKELVPVEQANVFQTTNGNPLLAMYRQKVKDMVEAGKRFEERVKQQHGDLAVAASRPALFETLAAVSDTDGLRAMLHQVARSMETQLFLENVGLRQMLEDLAAHMDHLQV